MTVDPAVLNALGDYDRVWGFLASRKGRAHIVGPPEVLERILARAKNPEFSASTDLTMPIVGGKDVFVWDLDPADLEAAKKLYTPDRVFGIIHDVWCGIITKNDIIPHVKGPAASPSVNYAIVCAPRSGSEFLCELLTKSGFGRPREHIREFFIALCKAGRSFDDLLLRIMQFQTGGNYFGTKVTSTKLYELRNNDVPLARVRQFLYQQNFRIILLSRDPAEQAVSAYFARLTGVWKIRDSLPEDSRHSAVEYDSEALLTRHRLLRVGGRRAAEFAEQFPAVLHVEYSDLDSDPQSVLRRIAGFLGVPGADAMQVDLSGLPRKISTEHAQMQEYLTRLRSELA